jgi:hypothetical protein
MFLDAPPKLKIYVVEELSLFAALMPVTGQHG